jgi:hypothetical protein
MPALQAHFAWDPSFTHRSHEFLGMELENGTVVTQEVIDECETRATLFGWVGCPMDSQLSSSIVEREEATRRTVDLHTRNGKSRPRDRR